jgi:hypothetical protein
MIQPGGREIGFAHTIASRKFTRCAPEKVDHFLSTLVRSRIGAS